jgi:signal transduction histidine kinase/pSer/pThr/pTyr-binding forkhead associated (FHA) protein
VPTLSVVQGPDKGLRVSPQDGVAIPIGRASKLLPLTDFTVSRQHAELKPEGRGWALNDLKSANGTYLNGRRLERPTRLKHGDQIRMGATVLFWDATADTTLPPDDEPGMVLTDLSDLDAGRKDLDPAIIGSVAGGDDSMILASPAAAEAVRSWRVMSSLLDAVGAILSPNQLVQRVMDVISEEVPVDSGFILLKEPATGKYEIKAVKHQEDSQERVRPSKAIVEYVLKKREGILCTNAASDARLAEGGRSDSLLDIGLQSVICVPLPARDEVLGVICICSPLSRHIYTDEQLRLVAAIGQMAGLAIEDARLVNERMRTERLAAAGETVAALSHYIKNILQGVMGGSDVVEMGLRSQNLATIDQGWQVVHGNLDKIYSLTMNMLAFAKKREPLLEPVQFNLVVEDVLKLVGKRAEDRGIALKHTLGEPMPAITMDENGIHQVVLNIVGNAIDAVARGTGVVNVKTWFDQTTESAQLTVGDNGPGFADEVRRHLFDPFYSTKGHGGTGLGLAVAKKIVDEHRGSIEVTSEPGEGTLIRVIVPANPAQGVDSAATHGPARRET